MDRIKMAQDRDRWPSLVKTVINHLVPYMGGIPFPAVELTSYKKNPVPWELVRCKVTTRPWTVNVETA